MSTAIFGGTFNPVHKGHIRIVQSALEEFMLERIVIVPNGNPPHKKNHQIADFNHRYNMLKIAFDSMDKVYISDYEAGESKYRYSLDTMRYFRSKYGDDTFFIIGADSLITIHTWYEYETLLKENRFIIFRRSGDSELDEFISKYKEIAREICISDMPLYDASSSDIRSGVKNGILNNDILADDVYYYIKEHGLYGGLV